MVMSKRKPDISLGATARERKEVVDRIKKITRLLLRFNIQAFAFGPGVRGYIIGHGTDVVDFDETTLKYMTPLLKELIKWREYGKKLNVYMSKEERRKHETVCKGSS